MAWRPANLLAIGADPADSEERRLQKVLVLAAALMVIPAALGWGAVYWAFDEPVAAAIPWAYVVLSPLALAAFSMTRRYPILTVSQFGMFLVLPFALQLALGGFVAGSAVALWAWIAPLGARVVDHRRAAQVLLVLFVSGTAISAALEPLIGGEPRLPPQVVAAFFALNVIAVATITFTLIGTAVGGREGSLASMRGMVRRYFSPAVAETILADPSRQELGGEDATVTALFADLGGYTAYSQSRTPAEALELVNAYFAAALPAISVEGGTPISLPGDAVLAVFGAPRPQPDHARRAARAALAVQAAGRRLAEAHPDWPEFRIGLNSGQAVVGNIGSDEFRQFTAIGDTINMAQRFQALAEPGQVVIGPATRAALGSQAEVDLIGPVTVKGAREPMEPAVLRRLPAS